ncbi:hypothetical protein KUTeg_006224 [Tegillarca granosa]|uniref:Uncharacterized protein n=1 Tax=Tegillarca granosa TaxID=220873 RepID=A0ABQ9FIV2_TEGGR|nr:hypothetical protein KUTeg_006224 [Tegillarca granosa]
MSDRLQMKRYHVSHPQSSNVKVLLYKRPNMLIIYSKTKIFLFSLICRTSGRKGTAKRLKGFKIYVSNNHKRNGTNHYRTMKQNLCYKDKSNGNLSVFQNISCIKTMKGRYVTIYNKRKKPNAFLELCEVDVYDI